VARGTNEYDDVNNVLSGKQKADRFEDREATFSNTKDIFFFPVAFCAVENYAD
jgi:hypothetical protein